MKFMLPLQLPITATFLLLTSYTAIAAMPPHSEKEAGKIVANLDGRLVALPMLKSQYSVNIEGDVATVLLTQTFFNPNSKPLNATYLFPLNQKAAVYGMDMKIGDDSIKAVIQRKAKAKKTFEKAKSQGKAAALLTQHRPNMFTQKIANLMPETAVQITLRYAQTIPKIDGAYELVVPMVVGPRYEGKIPPKVAKLIVDDVIQTDDKFVPLQNDIPLEVAITEPVTIQTGNWHVEKLPAYPRVIGHNASSSIDPHRVTLSVNIKTPTALSSFHSNTHELKHEGGEKTRAAKFKHGAEIDNRDFILRYAMANDSAITAGALTHFDERKGFVSLMIEPPEVPTETQITPRELVFVLDTSGSMSGAPLDASKVFMQAALKDLRPDDHFRILSFSNTSSHFASGSSKATAGNIQAAARYISGLNARGGTEMKQAINDAFDTTPPSNAMRLVVFLTDGYIGRDREVIKTISQRIGSARIYAFGVGTSVNRFLLEGMAKEGRGYVRYIDPGTSSSEAAENFARDIKSPLLTDVSVDWNGLEVEGASPTKIPDLFAGGAVRVFARYKQGGKHTVFIKGLVNGRHASMPIEINLPAKNTNTESAIPVIWARERVFDLKRRYTLENQNPDLKEAITQLGLTFSLQTEFTSFVAVQEKQINANPENTKSVQIPLSKVKHVSTKAYPSLNLGGSSTPEPHIYFGFLMAFLLGMVRYWKALLLRLNKFFGRSGKRTKRLQDNVTTPYRVTSDSW